MIVPRQASKHLSIAGTLIGLAALSAGCASYVTPGPGVSMTNLAGDADIRERFSRQPAATWPARIALARVQGSGYQSRSYESHGNGNYSVVTQRDAETEADLDRIARLPLVAAVAPMNRMLLPTKLESDHELRVAAAALHADLLLAYSYDTHYRVDGREIGPLGVITLGTLPINDAVATSTASAAIFDVRTGFVYAVAEGSAQEKQLASAWTSYSAADSLRVRAEAKALKKLVAELEATWKHIIEQHAIRSAPIAGSTAPAPRP